MKDLARVELSQQVYSNFAGLSGHKATHILIYSSPGANAIDVGQSVRKAMAEMSKDFPEGPEIRHLLRHHRVYQRGHQRGVPHPL